jgi:elongation factor 1-gamma
MGRYGFGLLGIFGEEPNLEIRGAFMWRSTEIPFFVCAYTSP